MTTAPEPAPEVEVVVTIKLRGDRATIDNIADLAADLDRLLSDRYSTIYRGPSVRLTAEPPTTTTEGVTP